MIDPKAAQEREALLKRLRELNQEIAETYQRMKQGEARLPLEEQFRLNLERLIRAEIPALSSKIHVQVVRRDRD